MAGFVELELSHIVILILYYIVKADLSQVAYRALMAFFSQETCLLEDSPVIVYQIY